jgi:hypothetical protein
VATNKLFSVVVFAGIMASKTGLVATPPFRAAVGMLACIAASNDPFL